MHKIRQITQLVSSLDQGERRRLLLQANRHKGDKKYVQLYRLFKKHCDRGIQTSMEDVERISGGKNPHQLLGYLEKELIDALTREAVSSQRQMLIAAERMIDRTQYTLAHQYLVKALHMARKEEDLYAELEILARMRDDWAVSKGAKYAGNLVDLFNMEMTALERLRVLSELQYTFTHIVELYHEMKVALSEVEANRVVALAGSSFTRTDEDDLSPRALHLLRSIRTNALSMAGNVPELFLGLEKWMDAQAQGPSHQIAYIRVLNLTLILFPLYPFVSASHQLGRDHDRLIDRLKRLIPEHHRSIELIASYCDLDLSLQIEPTNDINRKLKKLAAVDVKEFWHVDVRYAFDYEVFHAIWLAHAHFLNGMFREAYSFFALVRDQAFQYDAVGYRLFELILIYERGDQDWFEHKLMAAYRVVAKQVERTEVYRKLLEVMKRIARSPRTLPDEELFSTFKDCVETYEKQPVNIRFNLIKNINFIAWIRAKAYGSSVLQEHRNTVSSIRADFGH